VLRSAGGIAPRTGPGGRGRAVRGYGSGRSPVVTIGRRLISLSRSGDPVSRERRGGIGTQSPY
jgi:hypothetical protein